MNERDVYLLAEVVLENMGGQKEVEVGRGWLAAARRLVKVGLLYWAGDRVLPTDSGFSAVWGFAALLSKRLEVDR